MASCGCGGSGWGSGSSADYYFGEDGSESEGTDTGLREACGVFGCVAAGDWPTQLDVAQLISLGLIGLQHR